MSDAALTIDVQPGGQIVELDRPTNIMSVIAQAARDPQCDVDKMRALLEMKREEEDRDAQKAFNRAFVSAKADIQPIAKNRKNEQTRSNYADLERIAREIDGVLSSHGLAASFGTEPSERENYYTMVCDLMHADGFSKRYRADIPIDQTGIKGSVNKTDTHAFGSSMTYGRRYLKLLIFDIATADDDGNAAGHREALPPEPTGPAPQKRSKANSRDLYSELQKGLRAQSCSTDLKEWGRQNKERIDSLPSDWFQQLFTEYRQELEAFQSAEKEEQERERSGA